MTRGTIALVLAALAGCSNPPPKAHPPDSTSAPTDTEPQTTPTSSTTPSGDTGTPAPTTSGSCVTTRTPTWSVGAPGPDPASPTSTCTDVGPVAFDVAIEWTAPTGGFVMNAVVAPSPRTGHASVFYDAGVEMREVDGATGDTIDTVSFPLSGDDGSTPTVGDGDGDGWPEFTTVHGRDVITVRTLDGTQTSVRTTGVIDEVVQYRDTDLDGTFESVLPDGVIRQDGTRLPLPDALESTGAFVADLDGDGAAAMFNGAGIWDLVTGAGVRWDTTVNDSFYGVPVDAGGQVGVMLALGLGPMSFGLPDGTFAWNSDGLGSRFLTALGDATGDGIPDVCSVDRDGYVLVDLNGQIERQWPGTPNGACSMADLDADGVYEILIAGERFLVLDGVTGDVLVDRPDLASNARDSAPIVADLDGDGSAEILLVTADGLVALGPATGRWARTRPVWNQLAYDLTSIRDDGRLVSAPIAPWETYRAFRAQPSHDGVRPDLEIEVTQGSVAGEMTVSVTNRGSAASAPDAVLRLVSWDGVALTEVIRATLPDALDPGQRVDTALAVDACVLQSLWFAEVVPVGDDCDYVNDRVEGHP